MSREVSLDQESCTGCGACAEICPDVFVMHGKARAARATVIRCENGDEGDVKEAITACPMQCIHCA